MVGGIGEESTATPDIYKRLVSEIGQSEELLQRQCCLVQTLFIVAPEKSLPVFPEGERCLVRTVWKRGDHR